MKRVSWFVPFAALAIFAAMATLLRCGGLEDTEGEYAAFGTGCKGRCSESCKCDVGEGDCDRDAHCKAGLVCPQNGSVNPPGHDECYDPHGGGGGGGGGGAPTPGNLYKRAAAKGCFTVFDKDRVLVGPAKNSDGTPCKGRTEAAHAQRKALMNALHANGIPKAVLTSNTEKKNGVYTAIHQLQTSKWGYGTSVFPDRFFKTPLFQVNHGKSKADEMRKILNWQFGNVVAASQRKTVFFDDTRANIQAVKRSFPQLRTILIDKSRWLTQGALHAGLRLCLGDSKQ